MQQTLDSRAVGAGGPGGGDDAAFDARALERRWLTWLLRGSYAGFTLSLTLHLVLLSVAAVWQMGGGQAGGGGERDLGGQIGSAIMTEEELGALEAAALEAGAPAAAEAPEVALATPEILEGLDGAGSAPGPSELGGLAESGSGAGGDIGGSMELGDGGAGGTGAAKFFGVEAVGSRFAYIVDISGSMQGPKLRELKIELIESVGSLTEHTQFFVSFFSTDAMPMGNRLKWTKSDEKGKEWARENANAVNAFGGTNPLTAFQIVFDLSPRPDAVYFMTDGLFDAAVATEVAKMNKRGKRVPIHTIGFDMQDRDAEKLLQRIAEESGGRYSPVGYPGSKK
jgi:hypothetical protein